MGFGLNTVVDALNGSAPGNAGDNAPGAAPGKRTRSATMSAPAGPVPRGPMALAITDERVEHEINGLRAASARAERVREAGGPAEGATARVAELAAQALPHVRAIAAYYQDREARQASAATAMQDDYPFARAAGRQAMDDDATRAVGDEQRQAQTMRALDTLARVALDLLQSPPPTTGTVRLRAAIGEIEAAAAPLGWTAAATPADARARSLSHVPCPEDPDRCYFSDDERADLRRRLGVGLIILGQVFKDECTRRSAALEAAIARSEKIGEFIATALVDAIFKVATGDVGGTVAKGLMATTMRTAADVAASQAVAATKTLAAVAADFGRDLAVDLAWSTAKTAHKFAQSQPDIDPRAKAVDFIARLDASYRVTVRAFETRIDGLDDGALDLLTRQVENTTGAAMGARLDELIGNFRSQIEPIGEIDPGLSLRKTETRAARLHGAGAPPRLALVRYTSDWAPDLVRATRQGVADLKEAGRTLRGHYLLDGVRRAEDAAWVADPHDEIEFVRWIDAPNDLFDLQAIADEIAIDLPIERVRGLSLLDTMGIREPPHAR